MARTCRECGRRLDGLMSTDESIDPFELIANSPLLIVAVCVIGVLLIVGFEALVR